MFCHVTEVEITEYLQLKLFFIVNSAEFISLMDAWKILPGCPNSNESVAPF